MDPAFWIGLVTVSLLGLVYGSFATALIHRVPSGIGWSLPDFRKTGDKSIPRSACPSCHATLGVRDLIPLFSWLFLRGRCRMCGAPIGWTYPAIELMSAMACVGTYMTWGLNPLSLVVMSTVPFLMALTVIDFKYHLLPNSLNALLAVLWAVFVLAAFGAGVPFDSIKPFIFGGIAGGLAFSATVYVLGLIMRKVLKKETLGFGDVKFFAVAGLWLGIKLLPEFMVLSGVLGVILGLVYRLVIKKVYFPFGPALIASFYILLLLNRPDFAN